MTYYIFFHLHIMSTISESNAKNAKINKIKQKQRKNYGFLELENNEKTKQNIEQYCNHCVVYLSLSASIHIQLLLHYTNNKKTQYDSA